jgi:hypothetical protein
MERGSSQGFFVGDNPFLYYYDEVYAHARQPEQLELFFTNLADQFKIWPKKLKRAMPVLIDASSPDNLDTVGDFFDDLWKKKLKPQYSKWEGMYWKKHKLSFIDFSEKLDQFYGALENNTQKDGFHMLRKPTTSYRMKHQLVGKNYVDRIDGKALDGLSSQFLAELKTTNPSYDPSTENVEVDHVLSCQVFNVFLCGLQNVDDYSFDRYFSLKTWINKCWNFRAVPKSVNGAKATMEAKVIKELEDHWLDGELSETVDMDLLRSYFANVSQALKTNAKYSFMDQVPKIKQQFIVFLKRFDPSFSEENMNGSYACERVCFCLRKNQSSVDRQRTYHLFVDVKFNVDEFEDWNTVVSNKLEAGDENSTKKRTSRRKEAYDKRRAERKERKVEQDGGDEDDH